MRLFRRRGPDGKPSGPWIAWGYDAQGERWSESTKQLDRKAAEAVARELEQRHADPVRAAAHEATVRVILGLLVEQYDQDATTGHRSRATAKMYRGHAGHVQRLLGEVRLALLDAADVDGYLHQRRREGASAHTIQKELVVLRLALKLAARRKLWGGSLIAVVPPHDAEYRPRERWLSLPEVQRLLGTLTHAPEGAAFVAFCVATGARLSEAENALRADVDLREHLVRLRGTKTEGSARVVPVVLPEHRDLLRLAVESSPEQPSALLLTRWSNPHRALRAACRRAGIAHASFNDLRRSHATHLRRHGAEPHLIAAVLGHATSTMAERVYGRLDPRALAAQLGAADMQQTEWTGVDSSDPLDTPDSLKVPENKVFEDRPCGDRTHDQQIKSRIVSGLRALEKPAGNVVSVFPRPRARRGAADVQQRAEVSARAKGPR